MRKVTTKTLLEMKNRGEKIAMLTAYDFLIAKLLDESGIDVILVGDSLGNVFQGHMTTLPVTLDDMIYHTKAACRGAKRAMVVVDMPFLSYQVSVEEAVKNCGRVLKETCAEGVKLEGGSEIIEVVRKLTSIGIPVMGHLGLTPQSIHKFGGYDVRGVDESEAGKILNDAIELEKAGAFAIVLEKIPAELAKKVTESVKIPTIGIGAGPHCDGQVLVVYDMLGLFEEFKPRFVRRYAELAKIIKNAFENYISDVKIGKFLAEGEFY
jgi:3-methyl-2-oxobutanoate hydroxymethyltransferase